MKNKNQRKFKEILIRKDCELDIFIEHELILKMLDTQDVLIKPLKEFSLKELQRVFQWIEKHEAVTFKTSLGHELQSLKIGNLLVSISEISFTKLRKLELRFSNVESLEILPRIHMPLLQFLKAGECQICSLKPFRKAHFPHLQSLGIQRNKLRETTGLTEANLEKVQGLILEAFTVDGLQTLNCLFKLNSSRLQQIWANRRNRIRQPLIGLKISRKFPRTLLQGV